MCCDNCGSIETHEAHPDLCCVCFAIAFGRRDHDAEHRDYEVNGIAPINEVRGFASLTASAPTPEDA